MNNLILIIGASILLTFCTSCKTNHMQNEKKKGRTVQKSRLIAFDFKPIKVRTMDMRPRIVIIEISVLYMSNYVLTRELETKRLLIKKIITENIGKKFYYNMLSVNDYDKLHDEFIVEINSILSSGRIKKIIFKNFNIKNMFK